MADKNVNSEQDNAYIATLLSKLRESLGQTDAASAVETVTPDASVTAGASSANTAEPAPNDDGTASPAMPDEEIPDEESFDAPVAAEDAIPTEADDPEEKSACAVPGDDTHGSFFHESVTAQEETPETQVAREGALPGPEPAVTNTEMAAPDVQVSSDISGPTRGEDVTPTVPETTSTRLETPGAFARTVQPGDPRFSGRNTAGRFLDYHVDDAEQAPAREASASPLDGIFDEPLFSHATEPVSAAPSATGDAGDGVLAAGGGVNDPVDECPAGGTVDRLTDSVATTFVAEPGMPVPDRVADDNGSAGIEAGAPAGGACATDAEKPASIWDTLPPLPKTAPEALSADADASSPVADPMSADPSAECTGEHEIFARRVHPPIADCTFDTKGRENVVIDKMLAASQDLVPEGAKDKQDALWRQELRHKRLITRIRVIALGVVLLLSVAVELIPPFPRALLSSLLLTRVPGALHLIDLQILLLAALIGIPQLVRGCSALRFRRIIPETLLVCGMIVSLVAGIVLTVVDLTGDYFCSLPAVLMMFASAMADFFRMRALSRTFDSYAAKGHHFCAVFSDVRTHPLLGGEFRDASNPHLFETASISGIDRFIPAARKRVECRRACWITFAISVGAALFSLLLSLVMHGGAAETVWAFTLTLTGVMPLTLFGAHRYLFAMLTFRVAEERVGIADEMTVYDYAHTGVMTFEDTEAFPAGTVRLNGIKLCGDFRLDKALYLTASVFDTVGGPLNGVFRVSTSDINISDNVDIRALYEDGIDARVNHDDVLIGTKAFLEARGVSVFRDVEDERAEQGRACVLYLAYMGTLSAKFHLNYRMSDAFESNVEYYAKHGVASAILTADPLLNRAFLDRISYVSDYDVRIVKKTRESLLTEDDGSHEATLITYGPRKTLRRMPFFFGAYARYQAIVIALMIVMASLAAVYVPLLLCFMDSTVPWLSFATQLIAGLPCVIFGFFVLRLNPNK